MKPFILLALVLTCCQAHAMNPAGSQQQPSAPPPSGIHEIWTLDHSQIPPAEQATAQSLQGLVNRKKVRIWYRGDSFYKIIETQLRNEGVTFHDAKSVWELVKIFRCELKGVIAYEQSQPGLNAATSLSGPLNALVVEMSRLPEAEKLNLPVLEVMNGIDEKSLWGKRKKLFAKGIAIEQKEAMPNNLRDFAVAHNAFTFYTTDSEFRKEIARSIGSKSIVYGWGPDEYRWVNDLSSQNVTGVAADWASNLTVLDKLPAGKIQRPHRPKIQAKTGERYVAFVMSDGDNLQWMLCDFTSNKSFWGSPLRGQFPMTWEICDVLGERAPRLLQYLYANASPNDAFIAGAGAPGYTFPHLQTNRQELAQQAAPMLQKCDLDLVSVLNANEGSMSETSALLDQPQVHGVIYKDYAPYHRSAGKIFWDHNKPCVSYRYILWEGLMEPEQIAAEVKKLPASPLTDTNSYALINVCAWSYGKSGGPMEAIKRTIDMLPPGTILVTADQLVEMLQTNFAKKAH